MKERPLTFWLSLVSGYVDTAGFIALGGIFTAHVTGNFVLAGASLTRAESHGVVSKLAMFPIFVIAVSLSAIVARRVSSKNPLFLLMLLEAAFLLVFSFGESLCGLSRTAIPNEAQLITAGTSGVIAMAIQNAFMRLHLSKFAPTTVMTGNVTQFAMDLLRPLSEEARAERRQRLQKFGAVLLGFLLGAVTGAILVARLGLLSVILPALIVLLLAIQTRSGNDAKQ